MPENEDKKTTTQTQEATTGESEAQACPFCRNTAWKGPACSKCPSFQKEHYCEGVGGSDSGYVDYFCIAESPYIGFVSKSIDRHSGWTFDIENTVLKTFKDAIQSYKDWRKYQGRYTYAIRCQRDKPKIKEIKACAELLHPELLKHADPLKPIMVFALGPSVLKSFGLKVKKYSDVQGRLLSSTLGDRDVYIFASFTKRQLAAKSGFLDTLQQHVNNFLFHVEDVHNGVDVQPQVPLDILSKNYVYPKTISELRELTEMIISYGTNPDKHIISVDTETNTFFPHRKKTKALSVIFGWDTGKATSIPLEHAEAPWTFEEAAPYIQQVLLCPKPKVFHNFKYDYRILRKRGFDVNNVRWDTMTGEHLISEDKKGFYGLKSLTTTYIPRYTGYDDDLKRIKDEAEKRQKEDEEKLTREEKDLMSKAEKRLLEDDGYAQIGLKSLNVYGAGDGDVTRQICGIQRKAIKDECELLESNRKKLSENKRFAFVNTLRSNKTNPLNDMMFNRIIPQSIVLAKMESNGMCVDREYVEELRLKMDHSLIENKDKILTMLPKGVFDDFNPASTAHLRKVFWGTGYIHPETKKCVCYADGIFEPEKTDTGQYTTNAATLKALISQFDCPFARAILQYRAIQKARNTYIENIYVFSEEDGRMHTTYNSHGTATGRLSSSNENMQNIPMYIVEHNIKKIFVPESKENVIANADAKAAEVRVYAAYSKDKNLIKALRDGLDPHSFFASVVYNPANILAGVAKSARKQILEAVGIDLDHAWSYEDFQNRGILGEYGKRLEKLRKIIKRVVFGILYGATKNKIASIVGIDKEQAQVIINSLFKMFPTIKAYIKRVEEIVEQIGVLETFIGRRRRFDYRRMSGMQRAKAKRQGVNFLIQSTSSDIVMDVLAAVDPVVERDLRGHLVCTVHDSIVADIPKEYIGQFAEMIEYYGNKRVLKLYPWMPVPFKWDVEVGPSYGELMGIDKYLAQNEVKGLYPVNEMDFLDHEVKNELASAV